MTRQQQFVFVRVAIGIATFVAVVAARESMARDRADDSASSIFSQIVNLFRRITNPKSAEVTATITPDGLPVIAPRLVFGDATEAGETLVRHDDALRQPLIDFGFLEQTGETFKIPMLYRGGLSVTQGKAFAPDEPTDEDEDERMGAEADRPHRITYKKLVRS